MNKIGRAIKNRPNLEELQERKIGNFWSTIGSVFVYQCHMTMITSVLVNKVHPLQLKGWCIDNTVLTWM